MGILDQLSSVLGNSNGGGFDPNSQAAQQWGQHVQRTPIDQLAGIFGNTARNMDPNQYRDHVTPGVGGTNPLGMLKGPAMAMVASLLMRHLMKGSGGGAGGPMGGMGGAGGGGGLGGMLGSVLGGAMGGGGGMGSGGGTGGGLGGLLGRVPGLTTSDPNRMDEHQIASLMDYARQHDPDAFGQAMAEAGHQDPSILHNLLGNQGLMQAAQQFMNRR